MDDGQGETGQNCLTPVWSTVSSPSSLALGCRCERIEKCIRFFYLLSGGVSLNKEMDFIASYFLFFFEQRPIQLGSDEVKNDNRGLKLRFDILEDRERETRLKIG